jgi:3-oxoacyl-(acyl-carrier-protein) synthase
MGGFNAMHALSTRNDDQQLLLDQWTRTETASFWRGAGALILEYEHAIAREQLFTKLVVVVCLLMLTILQHHIQMV